MALLEHEHDALKVEPPAKPAFESRRTNGDGLSMQRIQDDAVATPAVDHVLLTELESHRVASDAKALVATGKAAV